MPDTCRACGRAMDSRDNCGGDCVYCMAEAGDPECIKDCIARARTAAETIRGLQERIADRTAAYEAKDVRQVREIGELKYQLEQLKEK